MTYRWQIVAFNPSNERVHYEMYDGPLSSAENRAGSIVTRMPEFSWVGVWYPDANVNDETPVASYESEGV